MTTQDKSSAEAPVEALESAELAILRKFTYAVIGKTHAARGKNITVKLDNLLAAIPELHADGTVAEINSWFIQHTKKLAEEERLRAEKRKAAAAAGLAKLTPEERAALNV